MNKLFPILLAFLFFSCANLEKTSETESSIKITQYENGQTENIFYLIDGEVENYKTYYENGNIMSESVAIDSLKSKNFSYNENGVLGTITYFERANTNIERIDSKLISYEAFYDNGQNAFNGIFTNNNMQLVMNGWKKNGEQTLIEGNGVYILYLTMGIDDSRIEMEIDIKNGKYDGRATYYNGDGNVSKIESYKDGVLINE